MPSCRDMSELVTDYVERTLPLGARIGAWLHLRQCDMCRRYFDQMHKTIDLLARGPKEQPTPLQVDTVITAANTLHPDRD